MTFRSHFQRADRNLLNLALVQSSVALESIDRSGGPRPCRFSRDDLMTMRDTLHFWGFHNGGANFLFADGSVRFLGPPSPTRCPLRRRSRRGAVRGERGV